ncbi:MAG: sterol desaturase family protein [Planctomyces sp.]|nr:sterol desaturase family protein [Planctomyces sp.]
MPEQIEVVVRLSFFGGVLLLMTVWELIAPRRSLTVRKAPRWASNLGLVVLNMALSRILIPITAVGAALISEKQGWGLLHQVAWPPWGELTLAVLILDLAIYWQHVLFHAVPVLWRLHFVHHADLDFDVTTGLRFHTLEILISAAIKIFIVAMLGPSAKAVIVFEVLLNATAMFNHSNVRIAVGLDRFLRGFVVTPDMHRVHHSVDRAETNSNFGFNLPWWDILFRTYRSQPADGHEEMTIGLPQIRSEEQADRLTSMLMLPFQSLPENGRRSGIGPDEN